MKFFNRRWLIEKLKRADGGWDATVAAHKNQDAPKPKLDEFIARMQTKGYSDQQVKTMVDWLQSAMVDLQPREANIVPEQTELDYWPARTRYDQVKVLQEELALTRNKLEAAEARIAYLTTPVKSYQPCAKHKDWPWEMRFDYSATSPFFRLAQPVCPICEKQTGSAP